MQSTNGVWKNESLPAVDLRSLVQRIENDPTLFQEKLTTIRNDGDSAKHDPASAGAESSGSATER